MFLCNYDSKLLSFKVPKFYLEMIKAWEELEGCRNFEEKNNPIIFNNKDFLLKKKNDEELFTRNIVSIQDIFDENGKRAISHFQHLGIKGNKIVDVWNIGEAIFRSGKQG